MYLNLEYFGSMHLGPRCFSPMHLNREAFDQMHLTIVIKMFSNLAQRMNQEYFGPICNRIQTPEYISYG